MSFLPIRLKSLTLVYGSDSSQITPYDVSSMLSEEESQLNSSPYSSNTIVNSAYQDISSANYNRIMTMFFNAPNLASLFDRMTVGSSAFIYADEVPHSVNIEIVKQRVQFTGHREFFFYLNFYGTRFNIGQQQLNDYATVYNKNWSISFAYNTNSERGTIYIIAQISGVEPGNNGYVYRYFNTSIGRNSSEQGMINALVRMFITNNVPSGGGGDDPYSGGGYSEPGGGDPDEQNFDEQSDVIAEPTLPSYTATGSGMVTAYVPTLTEMNDIADYLIDPNIIQALAGTVLKLSDVIIGLNLFPFSVPASQSKLVSLNLMGARLGTGITCHYADQQFITLDMGSIQIEKCWDNCLDYNPYTRISLFLPFCGYYELDTDEVMGRTLGVKYKVDVMTGSCVALVIVDGSVLYQFAGQCASQIPVSSVSFDGMISSMIDLGMTVASAQAAVGGASAAAESAEEAFMSAKGADNIIAAGDRMLAAKDNVVSVKGAAGRQLMGATANAILSSKGFYTHAGGLSSAPGFLGVMKPFIIKKIPRQSVPEGYGKMRGYPSNIKSKLSDLSGYTEVEEIQLNIPNATVAEIAECERILKAGCYL